MPSENLCHQVMKSVPGIGVGDGNSEELGSQHRTTVPVSNTMS